MSDPKLNQPTHFSQEHFRELSADETEAREGGFESTGSPAPAAARREDEEAEPTPPPPGEHVEPVHKEHVEPTHREHFEPPRGHDRRH